MSETDERELRRAVLRGETAAWRTLYDRAYRPLSVFVLHRAKGDRELVEEVVQEAWMVAVRRIRSFDPDRGAFQTWLCGIAQRILLARRRGRAREAPTEALAKDGPPAVAASEAEDLVASAMAMLPVRYRDVLLAKYRERRSVSEIAASSGGSGKAVESLLARARSAFRECYERLRESHG